MGLCLPSPPRQAPLACSEQLQLCRAMALPLAAQSLGLSPSHWPFSPLTPGLDSSKPLPGMEAVPLLLRGMHFLAGLGARVWLVLCPPPGSQLRVGDMSLAGVQLARLPTAAL